MQDLAVFHTKIEAVEHVFYVHCYRNSFCTEVHEDSQVGIVEIRPLSRHYSGRYHYSWCWS